MARPFDPNAPVSESAPSEEEDNLDDENFDNASGDEGAVEDKEPATLLAITEEGPGANCEHGGQRIQAGFDANFNPTSSSIWITSEEYDEAGPSIVHRKCLASAFEEEAELGGKPARR